MKRSLSERYDVLYRKLTDVERHAVDEFLYNHRPVVADYLYVQHRLRKQAEKLENKDRRKRKLQDKIMELQKKLAELGG